MSPEPRQVYARDLARQLDKAVDVLTRELDARTGKSRMAGSKDAGSSVSPPARLKAPTRESETRDASGSVGRKRGTSEPVNLTRKQAMDLVVLLRQVRVALIEGWGDQRPRKPRRGYDA